MYLYRIGECGGHIMNFNLYKPFILSFLLYLPSPAINAAEWYMQEDASCAGNRAAGEAIAAITGGGLKLNSGNGPGKLYATIDSPNFRSIFNSKQDNISNYVTLDQNQAKSLSKIFIGISDDIKVPMAVNVASGVFTAIALPAASGTIAGAIFTYLFSEIDAAAVPIREAGLFIVTGGSVYRRLTVKQRQSDGNLFALASTEYTVKIGNEQRTFVVNACTYPIRLNVNEFQTEGPYNNKIIKQSDGYWKVWDIEDKRFGGEPLKYLYQSGGFYYFDRSKGISGVSAFDLHRISFIGGPWQFQNYDERPNGKFNTLYGSTLIR